MLLGSHFFMDILSPFPLCSDVQQHLSKHILTSTICTVTEWLELIVNKNSMFPENRKIVSPFSLLKILIPLFENSENSSFLVVKYLFNY